MCKFWNARFGISVANCIIYIMTDFKNDIIVLFKGSLPPTFREGDMASVGGFLVDHKNPTNFIATNV
jgi:cytochrome c-type biogenesis protein CcmE